MKLFLIKLGKVIGIIKREGIVHGGKRVVKSFASLIALASQIGKKGDVLFVLGGVGDSSLYRGFNVAEELRIHGFKCTVIVQDTPFLSRFVKNFKVFVFHRTLYTSSVEEMIKKIKEQHKEIIFETDDLVHDPKYLKHMDYYKVMSPLEKKLYENGVGGEILQDSYVEICTTTTEFLKSELEKVGKKVFLVRNKINDEEFEVAEKLYAERAGGKNEGAINIGYFSGTISHNKDFATVIDALVEIMDKYENVNLYLAGPLETDNILNKFGDRIKRLKFVPRKENYANISQMDINLAPLEIGNPFCEAKSELKFFEAGAVGVPTVAAATQTFIDVIADGVDGFVARDTEEWINKIDVLISSKHKREEMGGKAREKVVKMYSNKNSNNVEYYDYLRSKIA
ncbi:glycosyltransferase family 4 protein [Patescibacteria group bacterium]